MSNMGFHEKERHNLYERLGDTDIGMEKERETVREGDRATAALLLLQLLLHLLHQMSP